MNISILPLSSGNIGSICRALSISNIKYDICTKTSLSINLKNSDCLIIPGVGAYDKASNFLYGNELVLPIKEFAANGGKIIGICLGFQLLFKEGYEGGKTSKGLGFIDGLVEDSSRTFGKNPFYGRSLNIGWRKVYSEDFKQDLDQKYFYFVHRYLIENCENNQKPIYSYLDKKRKFLAGVNHNNIYGFQFHPEKSCQAGINLLKKTIQGKLI